MLNEDEEPGAHRRSERKATADTHLLLLLLLLLLLVRVRVRRGAQLMTMAITGSSGRKGYGSSVSRSISNGRTREDGSAVVSSRMEAGKFLA